MNILEAIITYGVPPWLGFVVLQSLGLRFSNDRFGFLGWAHVTGCLGIGLYLVIWMTLGLPLVQSTSIPVILLCAWLHWRLRRRRDTAYTSAESPSEPTEVLDHSPPYQRVGFVIVVASILAFSALAMSSASASAVTKGDEIRHWTMKAKMVYAADGFGPDFEALAKEADRSEDFWAAWDEWLIEVWPTLDEDFKKRTPGPGTKWDYHLDYPLLNPLLHVWAYAGAGEILHWQNRFLITGFTIALLLILAGALRSLTKPAPLIGAMLLLTMLGMAETTNALKWSLADGMVATGLLLTVDALRRFRQDGDHRWWCLAVIGAAVMVWSKNEGILYLLCVAVGCASVKLKLTKRQTASLLLPLGIIALTWISNTRYGFTSDLVTDEVKFNAERFGALFEYFWREILTGPWWAETPSGVHCSFLHLAFLGLLLLFPGMAFGRDRRLITCTILCLVSGQILIYLITPHKLEWHLRESALRVVWQGTSLMVLWIGTTSSHLLKPKL